LEKIIVCFFKKGVQMKSSILFAGVMIVFFVSIMRSEPPMPSMPPYNPSSGKNVFGVTSNTNARLQNIEQNTYYVATTIEDIDTELDGLSAQISSGVSTIESMITAIDTCAGTSTLESMTTIIDSKIDMIEDVVDDIDVTVSAIETLSLTIESQLSAFLDAPSCASMVLTGDAPIEITESGPYCLGENLTFGEENPTAINIFADEVVIDMSGYSITGDGTTGTVAINTNNHAGVIIRNGFINNCDTGIEIGNGSFIKVSNMIINGVLGGISASSITGLFVENCFMTGFCVTLSRDPISCGSQRDGINVANGAQIAIRSTTVTEFVNGITINSATGVFLMNCSTYDNIGNGVAMTSDMADVWIAQCSSTANQGTGYSLGMMENVVLKDCSSSDNEQGFFVDPFSSSMAMTNCDATSNDGDGFSISSSSTDMKNCSSKLNNGNGFTLSGTDMTVDGCVAVENVNDGISVTATASDTVIRGSVSNSNGDAGVGNGVDISPAAHSTQLFNCSLANNANLGVYNGPGSSVSLGSSKIFSNIAYSNSGGDFSGVPNGIVASTLGAVASATYWMNISL
jgi:hypothetical protein